LKKASSPTRPQHVQDHRALVVDHRAEHAPFASDVAQSISQIDRSLRRHFDGPPSHLLDHAGELIRPALALGVQRGEVLREAFADPLLVVILPADRLPPPLVRDFMRQEEARIVVERDGIVAPRVRRSRERLVENRKIRGTVAAGQVAFGQGQREAVVRRIADNRRIETKDVGRALSEVAGAVELARVGLHGQRQHRSRFSGAAVSGHVFGGRRSLAHHIVSR
jgi:hypothetical protein